MTRQIVLDTETTGLEPSKGHRIIEIGCVEMINRRITDNTLQLYINPERDIDEGAQRVHGITRDFLKDKPVFKDVVSQFLDFIKDAELIIHNAPFDVGFLDHELKKLGDYYGKTAHYAKITDTLTMARQKHPGQKNNLDALCKRYNINNQHRTYHGALLDSQILAHVYLMMTRGQASLLADENDLAAQGAQVSVGVDSKTKREQKTGHVVKASESECEAHELFMREITGCGN